MGWLKRVDDADWVAPSPLRQAYIVIISMLVIAVQVVDRQVLSLVVEPMRKDLGISDFQISLLGGLAFALFYAICAIPIGRIIDGGRRPTILAIGMLLWSCATMGMGFSTVFAGLFVLRMAVAAGEATSSPSTLGMITDIFLGKTLGRMVTLVMIGVVMGNGVALIGGGFLLQLMEGHDHIAGPFGLMLRPWQVVYIAAGLPGLILAPLIFFTIRDPPRRQVIRDADGRRAKASFKALWTFIRDNPGAVGAYTFGYSIWSIGDKALTFWAPTYLVRAFDMPSSKAGYLFGTISVVVNVVGNLIVGWLIDRANAAGKLDGALRIGRNAAALFVIPILIFPFLPSLQLTIVALTLGMICSAGYSTVTVALYQLAPNQVRAQYTGFYLLVSNIIGGVIGTSLVAVVTEHVFHDRNLVGYSVAVVCAGAGLIGAVILALGMKPYAAAMHRVRRESERADIPA